MVERRKGRRLFFISILFMVLMNFPVLSIFNVPAVVAGFPVLYLYITLVWLVCIAAIGLFISKQEARKQKD